MGIVMGSIPTEADVTSTVTSSGEAPQRAEKSLWNNRFTLFETVQLSHSVWP